MTGSETADPVARRVTMRDVAQLAGVDVAVVSKMLSGDASLSVRAETRERVLRAVAQLEYRPNYAARSLRRWKRRSKPGAAFTAARRSNGQYCCG